MCAKGEGIYFNCAVRTGEDENNCVGKVVSVCAKFNMSSILEKTFLFDGGSEPIQQSKTKMYLIEGDRVLVTDSTAGWCKVSYQARIKMITKWAQCKSINFSAS
ncbi:hypothetical protein D3C76_1051170 [compost metagenome]